MATWAKTGCWAETASGGPRRPSSGGAGVRQDEPGAAQPFLLLILDIFNSSVFDICSLLMFNLLCVVLCYLSN